ncbi:alpha/beta fold hydrolase [Xanthobacter sp. TB0139]|uniref:alpha/beta fold hydrolase n=1 Tax=Xanthobacter sp. TB0139 TaxID=3459178 RepID=UPI004039EA3C
MPAPITSPAVAPSAASTLPAPVLRDVLTPDGLRIRTQQWGAPEGRDVLFIHGFSQAGLCWQKQVMAPELAHLRMVTYDFRGHGASDKPVDATFYKEPERWAGELAAILEQCELTKPVLVGWSYAGRIISDYLSIHGSAALGGIVFVDAVTSNERHFYGTCNRLMRQMYSENLEENISATRTFLRNCFEIQPDQEMFETFLAANMVVPAPVRAALFGRPCEHDTMLRALDLPVLVTQGDRDIVVAPAMAEHIAALIPEAELQMFEGIGHAPFVEAAESFNATLSTFIRARCA